VDEDWVHQRAAASGGSAVAAPSSKKAKAVPAAAPIKTATKKAKASAPVSSSGPLSGLCFAITGYLEIFQ
jgi:hypothetical protein